MAPGSEFSKAGITNLLIGGPVVTSKSELFIFSVLKPYRGHVALSSYSSRTP